MDSNWTGTKLIQYLVTMTSNISWIYLWYRCRQNWILMVLCVSILAVCVVTSPKGSSLSPLQVIRVQNTSSFSSLFLLYGADMLRFCVLVFLIFCCPFHHVHTPKIIWGKALKQTLKFILTQNQLSALDFIIIVLDELSIWQHLIIFVILNPTTSYVCKFFCFVL